MRQQSLNSRSVTRWLVYFSLLLLPNHNHAFHARLPRQQRHAFLHTDRQYLLDRWPESVTQCFTSSSTRLNMFMGSDGGILGIGTPEIFTILLVGYFVLGPSDLYKIVKEVGKFIQNVRTFSTDLTTTFESNMESQLQLEELRKAQRELNDAFSFRRSINVDQAGDAFSTKSDTYSEDVTGSPMEEIKPVDEVASVPPKKIRRRVRKKADAPVETNIPQDLEMPMEPTPVAAAAATASSEKEVDPKEKYTAKELAKIEAEFNQYTQDEEDAKPATTMASANGSSVTDAAAAQSRFQQQLSGNWNEQILANQDKLEPLAAVMNKIALLEKEKRAATDRLEEEFKKRAELEKDYYEKQRKLLEEAAQQLQDQAVGLD